MVKTSTARGSLLVLWFAFSFGVMYFARDLHQVVAGWPLSFWLNAQGTLLVFLAIVALFAWVGNRHDTDAESVDLRRLHRLFGTYVLCLLLFLAALYLGEKSGLSRQWIGALFLLASVLFYAGVGIYGRTTDMNEYYVAGRRIPAVYNGMATAADWMSAASFISLAGGLYAQGFSGSESQAGGLAYIVGWTGGFCLLALLVAPQLRGMNIFTVPDFFQLRYGGQWPRRLAALAAILCSFTYVVAQIYGVGLISSRLTGVQFEIGVLLGLGGVLVCSFLGGMRAITWTQVAQYVVMILAFLIPASWLAYKQLGNPLAPWVYGQQIAQVTELEQRIINSPSELQVIEEYARRAKDYEQKLQNVQLSLDSERLMLKERLRLLNEERADAEAVFDARRAIVNLPKDAEQARKLWSQAMQDNLQRAKPLGGMPPHAKPFAGDPQGTPEEREMFDLSRRNFIALVFCLMVGTMGLPHLLTRFFTTSSQAETRRSVAWSLLFIALLYISAPAIAVMVKFEVMSSLVGKNFEDLAPWMAQWAKVDGSLISLQDVNGDQRLQFSELRLGPDLIMLAMPEIGGLPYVISGLVAAGGLAAALSTADGLLLTIGNALAHDLYFRGATGQPRPGQSERSYEMRRVIASKFALLLVALTAAYVAAQKPADILYLVSASFSLAGAAFVPAMVLGIYWSRTTAAGALCGMVAGIGVTIYYMAINASWLRETFHLTGSGLWWGIQPISSGLFGVAAGTLVMLGVSLLTRGKGLMPSEPAAVEDRAGIHL